jgi:hypothetical protein
MELLDVGVVGDDGFPSHPLRCVRSEKRPDVEFMLEPVLPRLLPHEKRRRGHHDCQTVLVVVGGILVDPALQRS